MNDKSENIDSIYQLNRLGVVLKTTDSHPANFELLFDGVVQYVGEIKVVSNGVQIQVADTFWKFRQKPDRLELWCQVQHIEALSININYYFASNALIIEYLARSSTPTRIDISHAIKHPVQEINEVGSLNPTPLWKYKRYGLPCDHLIRMDKANVYEEAFSAKQWVYIDKLEKS